MAGCLLRLRVGRSRESPHCYPRGKLSPVFPSGRRLSARPTSTVRSRRPRAAANTLGSAYQCRVEPAVPQVQPRQRREHAEPAQLRARLLEETSSHRGDRGVREIPDVRVRCLLVRGVGHRPGTRTRSVTGQTSARLARLMHASGSESRRPLNAGVSPAGSRVVHVLEACRRRCYRGLEGVRFDVATSVGSTAAAAGSTTELAGRRRRSHGRRAGHAPSVRDLPSESAGRSVLWSRGRPDSRVSGSGGSTIHL